jgi:hypothetical protein
VGEKGGTVARNVIGITGIGLRCSLVTGGLLAWTLPMGYLAFCQYALLEAWTALLLTIRGPRTRLSHDS